MTMDIKLLTERSSSTYHTYNWFIRIIKLVLFNLSLEIKAMCEAIYNTACYVS